MPRSPPTSKASRLRSERVPFEFALDGLTGLPVSTRPMFGSTAVYVGERVVFILRQKGDSDDGVWVAYDEGREAEALAALPSLAKITLLPRVRCWRKLDAQSPTFETDVARACELIQEGGPLGKIPLRQAKKNTAARNPSADGRRKTASRPRKR